MHLSQRKNSSTCPVAVDHADHFRAEVQAVGQQHDRFLLTFGVNLDPSKEVLIAQAGLGAVSVDANLGIGDHAGAAVFNGKRARAEHLEGQVLSEAGHDVAADLDDGGEQVIGLVAAVQDVEAPRLKMLGQRVLLRQAVTTDHGALRGAVQDVEMEIDADMAFVNGSVRIVVFVVDRPGHARSDRQEGAVHRQQLAGEVVEPGIVRQDGQSLLERFDQRQKQGGIEQRLSIGQRTVRHARQVEAPARLGRLKDVFDPAERLDDGIEKSDQMGDDDVVRQQLTIAVGGQRLAGPQGPKGRVDEIHEPTPGDAILFAGHDLDHRIRLLRPPRHVTLSCAPGSDRAS